MMGWERHSRQRYQQKPRPRGGTSVRVVNEGISGCKLDGCLCSKRFSYPVPPAPDPQNEMRLRPLFPKWVGLTWVEQLGLYGLMYSRLLQGKGFKTIFNFAAF